MLTGLEDGYPYRPIHEEAGAYIRANGIPLIDLMPCVVGHQDTALWVDPADQHPNAIAHRLFANELLATLEPLLP
jgi:hypothetical protein